jgi:hypothetical protein
MAQNTANNDSSIIESESDSLMDSTKNDIDSVDIATNNDSANIASESMQSNIQESASKFASGLNAMQFSFDSYSKNLSALQVKAKTDIGRIRAEVYNRELILLAWALHQMQAYHNQTALRDVVANGLSGKMKSTLKFIIPNILTISRKDGVLFDAEKTPPAYVAPESGKLRPIFNQDVLAFIYDSAIACIDSTSFDPCSDQWNEVFKAPEKSVDERLESIKSNAIAAVKKGVPLSMQIAMLQELIKDSQS